MKKIASLALVLVFAFGASAQAQTQTTVKVIQVIQDFYFVGDTNSYTMIVFKDGLLNKAFFTNKNQIPQPGDVICLNNDLKFTNGPCDEVSPLPVPGAPAEKKPTPNWGGSVNVDPLIN